MFSFINKSKLQKNLHSFLEYYKREETQEKLKLIRLTLLLSFICYYSLEISNRNFLFNGIKYTLMNILMVYSFIAVLGIFTVKRWISAAIISAVGMAVSLINFYTVLFRNQPASTLDIGNIGTAMDVLGSYKPGFHITVVLILLLFAVSVFVITKLRAYEKDIKFDLKKYTKKSLRILFLVFVFFYVSFFAKYSIKPKLTLVWSWEESYHRYGYLASSQELFMKSFNVARKPDNYDEEALKKYVDKTPVKPAEEERKPDIILILNETFYDLNLVTDLKADKEIFPNIKALENKISGYAFVPGVGGGTNRSEYELLTSNTLHLMPGITPFSFLDLSGANSIVSFLKEAGYTTWAAHCAPGLNYSRGTGYPKLGFDNVLFSDKFKYIKQYGNRPYATDEFMYEMMIADYHMMGWRPRFMYMLTIQNHGGWDMNPPESDTVHAATYYGKYDKEVDEFLSCVALSDEAFGKLVEYYENVERDVIICMVGDHSPSWVYEFAEDRESKFEDTFVCATPFVMWANFDLETEDVGFTSLPYLAPLLLKNAGLNLSPFYNHMMNMYEKYPVVTANNYYADDNNIMYSYSWPDCAPEINTYFDMVYNNVSPKANRIDELFKHK